MDNKKILIKKLGDKDLLLLQELIIVFKLVFEMGDHAAAKESYLKKFLGKPGFVAIVIIHENKIAGGLTAYELPMYYSEYSEMYLYDIGVKPEFQRKGFGKKLIFALKEYCKKNKIREFFVEANEEDKYAVDFYRLAGGKPERVIHFNFPV